MNNVSLMGRLTKDPELKTTQSGLSVTSFSIAVQRQFTKEKQVDFLDIVAWRQTAEFICKYFTKGQMIALTGSIQTRMYKDKNDNKRKAVEVLANNVYFCGSKGDNNQTSQAGANETTDFSNLSEFDEIDMSSDDLPRII